MNAKTQEIKLPSLLAFERKLETSDALMHSGNWNDINNPEAWKSIRITKRQNRSTQSAYGIEDSKKSEPNPVASDSDDANLPIDKDTLRVKFTLRIIGNLGKPFSCNDPDFQRKIIDVIAGFKENDGSLKDLAKRYAYNIANGRFLWRNRVCAEKITIFVHLSGEDKPLEFDATTFSMSGFDENSDSDAFKKLMTFMFDGLNGDESSFKFMTVEAYAKLGNGQHVFPSQEMNMGEKKKVLFQLDDCAAIHNVKIGNAIRTIDNWYGNAEFPIAVEPYGSVTQIGQAFRKSKNDLYTLLVKWLSSEKINDYDKNYVVANLIRGGLFQGEKSDKKKKGSEE